MSLAVARVQAREHEVRAARDLGPPMHVGAERRRGPRLSSVGARARIAVVARGPRVLGDDRARVRLDGACRTAPRRTRRTASFTVSLTSRFVGMRRSCSSRPRSACRGARMLTIRSCVPLEFASPRRIGSAKSSVS